MKLYRIDEYYEQIKIFLNFYFTLFEGFVIVAIDDYVTYKVKKTTCDFLSRSMRYCYIIHLYFYRPNEIMRLELHFGTILFRTKSLLT